jgi:uncharacterized alpha-E superfamily protein
MLSRVADNLYWMSRYLERAEHTARTVGVNLDLAIDRAPESSGQHWDRLFESLKVSEPDPAFDAAQVATALTFDTSRGESIAAYVAAARENARQVREQVSSEMWEQLNRLYWQVRQASRDADAEAQPYESLRSIIDGIYLFKGVTNSTMSRGEGWHYIQLGRFIERAAATSLLLDVHVRTFEVGQGAVDPAHAVEWVGLLRSCTAFEAYCRRYTATLEPKRIADFLLLDAEFPRSVRFAVEQIENSLRIITRLSGRSNAGRPERLAGRLRASLYYAQVDEIVADSLHQFLESVRRQCSHVHTATYHTFITYQVEPALA